MVVHRTTGYECSGGPPSVVNAAFKVVSRCFDPQLQVVENHSYLFNLRPSICKSFYTYLFLNKCNLNNNKID